MSDKTFDLSTVIGIGVTLLFLVAAVLFTGLSNAGAFFNFPSFMVVILGTATTTIACFSWKECCSLMPLLTQTIVYRSENATRAVRTALKIAEIGFRKGIMQLDGYPELMRHNHFLEQGILLVSDSVQPQIVEGYLLQQIAAMEERHYKLISMLRKAGEIAPAMGLIGTLIGLVEMLGNLSDPMKIGPSMAVALLTTFYGAVLSHLILYPLAAKLERNSRHEATILQIYTKAMVSIARRENPRHLEIVLNAMLPSEKRLVYFH
jgi:chemotaxis protein MotA